MSGRSFHRLHELLGDLLDRREANPSADRLVARIAFDRFTSIGEQDAFLAGLGEVERDGGVRILRQGPRHDRRITGVALADPAVIYDRLSRSPADSRVRSALAPLRAMEDLPPDAQAVIDRVATSWERGVSQMDLRPGDVSGLETVLRLALAAVQRAQSSVEREIDFRSFSRAIVGDSKALERHLSAVARVLDGLGGGKADAESWSAADRLAAVGVTRLPQPFLVHGPLQLDGKPLPATSYVGLPPEDAARLLTIARPRYVLTIENYASFVRHIREVDPEGAAIVIYSGGFPSRAGLGAILSIASAAGAPMCHWGDMDPGGVRIFRHIEAALGAVGIELRPHLMTPELLQSRGAVAPESRSMRLAPNPGSSLEEVAALITARRLVHEQEELDPMAPAME